MGILVLVLLVLGCQGDNQLDWEELSKPLKNGNWIQPSPDFPSQPVWGHLHGIRVGLAPMPGPRGLIRIYTPYLGHEEGKMINFLALEPIVREAEQRSFSELEMSEMDGVRGKRFWSAADSISVHPQAVDRPVQGTIQQEGDRESLTVYIFSEPFESGAQVYVRLKFYSDSPYEIEISTHTTQTSADLDYFIVTATMGNFARLRTIYLDDRQVASQELWPAYRGDAFTDHRHFSIDEFVKDGAGRAYVIAAPDETNPAEAQYDEKTSNHWKYYGEKATQYWSVMDGTPNLECLVNGRYTYWMSKSPIPGGISYENFELKPPFEQGMTFVFGVDPGPPEDFIDRVRN